MTKKKNDGVYIYSITSQSCSLAETLVIFAFRKVWLLYGVPVIISVTIQSLIAQSETRPLKSSSKYWIFQGNGRLTKRLLAQWIIYVMYERFGRVRKRNRRGCVYSRPKTIWPAAATICVASSCFRSKMEDLEMYSDNLLFNKRQLGPIGQYTV